jgi:hypothetical protein
MLEKSKVADQRNDARRRKAVLEQILAREELFRRQGIVASTWRSRGGRTFGPYYGLVYRKEGRQRSIYLGRSAELADEVRALLIALQGTLREERDWRRLRRALKSALRDQKAAWSEELAKYGFLLKGYEVRRWHAGWKGIARGRVACRHAAQPRSWHGRGHIASQGSCGSQGVVGSGVVGSGVVGSGVVEAERQ